MSAAGQVEGAGRDPAVPPGAVLCGGKATGRWRLGGGNRAK